MQTIVHYKDEYNHSDKTLLLRKKNLLLALIVLDQSKWADLFMEAKYPKQESLHFMSLVFA